MTTEIARVEPAAALVARTDPEAEVEWAARCAKALMRAIDSNPQLKVRISDRDYLKVEAWQTIGAMAQVDQVQTVWCREYTPPGTQKPIGWEARVEVVDRNGTVRGSGEAMCVRTETRWQSRDEFALRSMAQTRAMGKAYRMALAFIVSLAGFEPTPAEEMIEAGARERAPASAAPAPVTRTETGEYVFPIGKWKGTPISQAPRDYVVWFAENGQREDVRAACQQYLGPAAQTVLDGELVDDGAEDIPF